MTSVIDKLSILADAAKYDASCSSSGSRRANRNTGPDNSISTRRFQHIIRETLKNLGVATRRARHFISCPGLAASPDWDTPQLREHLIAPAGRPLQSPQLSLFG
ncbi:hypothetical protein SAMN05216578_11034 [Halopseudomonas formosensis]|uniref:Uncharacterized protein n=1 Tax=Halopseudomonas formosensis TaxID=1002526 RepID=A0A1I6C0W6_9GAMM|nr:hypothetical protein [Halopseudomonas formosensis]SFQ86833.1 hypothetical protein SAMN05216578_11034 [Halopseudomonas formosensis]